MNILLWILQGLLGAMFITAGIMKSTQPKEKLARLNWTARYSPGMIKFIGVSELLAGLGLILPWATGFAVILTPVAAGALALIMIMAALDHLKNDEKKEVMVNVIIFVLAVIVAFGRF